MESEYLPSINDLENIISNTTVALSLRVKESTKVLFDLEAKKSHNSTNTIISTLLDIYADRFIARQMTDQELKIQALQRYLELAAKKAYALDFEILFGDTINLHPSDLFNEMNTPVELIKECAMWAEGKPTPRFKDSPLYFLTTDGSVAAESLGKDASVVGDVRTDGTPFVQCYLRIDYWIMFMAIMRAYEAKMAKLFPDRAAFLGERTYHVIAQSANTSSDRKTFAESTVRAIMASFKAQLPGGVERRYQDDLTPKVTG